MSHDTHFLQRLSRVTQSQADRALALYRDPALVRALLQDAKIPEGAERVAIALEAEDSPHVIVQRDGHFITCLGAGMKVGDAPVLSRAKLDGALARVTRHRDAEAALEEMKKRNSRSVYVLYSRVLDGAELVHREDVEPLLAVQPLLGTTFLSHSLASHDRTVQAVRLAAGDARPASARGEHLRSVWRRLWAGSHQLVLGASEHAFNEEPLLAGGILGYAAILAGETGNTSGILLRHLFASAKLGRDAVNVLKENDRANSHPLKNIPFRLALAAVAYSHARVHGEVVKYLSRPAALHAAFTGDLRDAALRWNADVDGWILRFLEDPDAFAASTRPALESAVSQEFRGKVDPVTLLATAGTPAVVGDLVKLALGALPQALKQSAAGLFLPRAAAERFVLPEP